MWLTKWFRPPRRLLGLFLGITLVLAVALAGLGYRLFQQDRQLERQQIQQQLTHAAELVAAGLLRELSGQQERLAGLLALPDADVAAQAQAHAEALGSDGAIVVLGQDGCQAFPPGRLPYDPCPPGPDVTDEPSSAEFATGEALEFQEKNYARAGGVFRRKAMSEDPSIRAGALLRLGRTLRKSEQVDAALAVYGELLEVGAVPVGGLPADLAARHTRCVLLEELDRQDELLTEARALYAALHDGRWRLTRAAYGYYLEESRRWHRPGPVEQDEEAASAARAAGAESLWEGWRRYLENDAAPAGHVAAWLHDRPVLLLWQSTKSRLVGLVAGPIHLETWLSATQPVLDRQGVRVALSDAQGHPVVGEASGPASPRAVLRPAETHLPWTAHVVLADPAASSAKLAGRRRLMLFGLALAGLLVVVGGYFVSRAVTRELEVARLQSDFVSAVSHEFRSPLASMRQLSELLWEGRVSSEDRRRQYYQALRRESERLHRLVEGLLDFGRMEAGARQYRFDTVDPATFVQDVAREFGQEVAERGYTVQLELDGSLAPLAADREALSRALWNLLDNAVKYSPTCKTIWLEATQTGPCLTLSVRDQGLGIDPEDDPRIFKKFVRAASADDAGVKGTGLGLAMAQHIVDAHGGGIQVESQLGVGSKFTIVLPSAKERR
jgi:signal transduction histidine kinase